MLYRESGNQRLAFLTSVSKESQLCSYSNWLQFYLRFSYCLVLFVKDIFLKSNVTFTAVKLICIKCFVLRSV